MISERLTSDAHQVIYQRREFGLAKLKQCLSEEFPRNVRAHSTYVWVAAALLYVPTFAIGWLVYEGYLAQRGHSATFYSFVATHSAFELTAIVLCGAAGLKIGHSLVAPGRLGRVPSLVAATSLRRGHPAAEVSSAQYMTSPWITRGAALAGVGSTPL